MLLGAAPRKASKRSACRLVFRLLALAELRSARALLYRAGSRSCINKVVEARAYVAA